MFNVNNNNNAPAPAPNPYFQRSHSEVYGHSWSDETSQESKTTELVSGFLAPVVKETETSKPQCYEWKVNFALLYSAYQRTNNEKTRELIRFLMTNYLQKAAFLNSGPRVCTDPELKQSYEEMLQLGQMLFGGMYHRGISQHESLILMLDQNKRIAAGEAYSSDLIALDTIEVQDLYKFIFAVAPNEPHELVAFLVEQFEKNLDRFPDENFLYPILIDITEQLDQSLITNHEPEKIEIFKKKLESATAPLNQALQLAAEQIKEKYPNQVDIQEGILDYLQMNTAVVSRQQITNRIGVLCRHLIFDQIDFDHPRWKKKYSALERVNFIRRQIKNWVEYTGVGIGAIHFRKATAELVTNLRSLTHLGIGEAVDYIRPGKKDVTLYESPRKILESKLFATFLQMAQGSLENVGPAQKFLSKATAKMMISLLSRLDSIPNDPIIAEIVQFTLFRLSQHLATAVNFRGDFRKFTQALDCAHAELGTLLAIYMPFAEDSFEKNFRAFLEPSLPMKPVTVGLAKSGMSIFAGINWAIMESNPNAVRICGAHSYYEEEYLLRKIRTLEEVLEDPIDKVDLYVGEFHHNIEPLAHHTHYEKGAVAADIRTIFAKKPHTDALTVALDATIDFIRSEDVKALLIEFEPEIQAGRLNFVVFRSGQKFDMLGFDNYFGGTYYIINNGDKKWEKFNEIKTDKAFQIDELSHQFFCWMAISGLELIDEYKELLFDNTQKIMQVVPRRLKPKKGREISISTFDKGVHAPFFEITLNMPEIKREPIRLQLHEAITRIFVENERLIFMRGSFGFQHPNLTWIEPKFRINPGLDPNDIPIYQEIFYRLEKAVKRMKKT